MNDPTTGQEILMSMRIENAIARAQRLSDTLKGLAELNRYDSIGRMIDRLLANGEIADYDDEIANRLSDARKVVRELCRITGVPLAYEPKQ